MSCSVGHRQASDPALLWLWCRLAAAVLIRLLACELPYATSVALKKKKERKKEMGQESVNIRCIEQIFILFWINTLEYGFLKVSKVAFNQYE